jgi:predicted TIM-barrel fold metal-dependent hydrolase
MAIIDSDAHVIETDHTWEFLQESDRRYRPLRVAQVSPEGAKREFWVVDGRLLPVRQPGQLAPNPDARGLGGDMALQDDSSLEREIDARVRHMDELGTDIQVLYPTLFIFAVTERPDVELALARSYNRWLSAIFQHARGRLRWAAVLPLLSMDQALEELRLARENGACAAYMRGIECGDKLVGDPYFYPLYAEASRLDIPVCVHTGNASPALMQMYARESFSKFRLIGVGAFHNLIFSGVPERFPELRFGFIEFGAQWLPYAISDLQRRARRQQRTLPESILRDNRVYVACETEDDLPHIVKYAGEDNLVIGTDYGHSDLSTELLALQHLQAESPLGRTATAKLLDDNARALYGL